MKYTVTEILDSAKQLADVKNNSFLTEEQAIRIINDKYQNMIQKAINRGDKSFIKTVSLNLFDNELPEDFYQLAEVYYMDNFNYKIVINNLPYSSQACYNSGYEIKNNKIVVHGFSTEIQSIKMEYYPIPKTLKLLPKEEPSYDDYMYPADDTIIGRIGKYSYYESSEGGVDVRGPKDSEKRPLFRTSYTVIDAKVIGNLIVVQYEEGVGTYNKYGTNIDWSESGNISIDCKGKITPRTASPALMLTDGENEYSIDNRIFIADDLIFNTDTHIIEETGERIVDYADSIGYNEKGYGYLSYNALEDVTTVKPWPVDDKVDVPNNFYIQLLAYYVAEQIKVIAGEDNKLLTRTRMEMEENFFDSLPLDTNATRIRNVY